MHSDFNYNLRLRITTLLKMITELTKGACFRPLTYIGPVRSLLRIKTCLTNIKCSDSY